MNIKLRTVSFISAVCAILVAVLGLLGYLPGWRLLGSLKETYIPMAPGTAVSFILIGSVLAVINTVKTSGVKQTLFLLFTFLVLLFGLLKVVGYLTGKDLNFEESLIPVTDTLDGFPVGRMSPITGTLFFFSGIAVFLLILKEKIRNREKTLEYVINIFGLFVLIVSFVFCLAYLYGNPLLYEANQTIPMALTTAIGFIFISNSVITIQKNTFPFRTLTDNSTRGYILRFILPLTALSALFGGAIILPSSHQLTLNPAIISAAIMILVVTIAIIVTTIISKHLGETIDEKNRTIKESEEALQKNEKKFRTLFETMIQGVVYQNSEGKIIDANPAAERILGLSLEQMKGRTSIDPRWKAVDQNKKELSGEKHPAMIALQTKKAVENFVQGIFNPKLNSYIWILINSIPQFKKGSDEPFQVYSTFLDITQRKQAEDELRKLKIELELKVREKTNELNERIKDLEQFQDATIERELRMEELRKEIEVLKTRKTKPND
jgi:PAS domain S-box-containing protein